MKDTTRRANYFCNHCGNYFVLIQDEKRECPSCKSNLIHMKHG